jgi:hypothetical protein
MSLLLVRVRGHVDPGPVLPARSQHLVERLHAREHLVDDIGVEGLVEARGPGEVPGVDEDVAHEEHGDRVVEAVGAGPGMADGRRQRGGVAEERPDAPVERRPRAGRVVVDRGAGR